MSTSPLQLVDDDFWLRPDRTVDRIADPYVNAEREALLFDAPQFVDIARRSTAPTQALRIATFGHVRDKPFRTSAVIVATDVVNNLTQAAAAMVPPTDETAPAERPAALSSQEGISIEAVTIDLREALKLPWEPGRYLVRLVVREEVSAPRLVELRAGIGFVDPEVEKARSQARLRTQVPALVPPPGEPGVSYLRTAQTPGVPEAAGIRLVAPRTCTLQADTPCLLRGAFRLPLLKRHIVPPATQRQGTEALRAQFEGLNDAAPTLPQAVVPITIVGSGTGSAVPSVWRLVLPVYDAIDFSVDPPRATGTFALDLRRLAGFTLVEQTWFLHAFSDEVHAGPLTVGLMHRPRTP